MMKFRSLDNKMVVVA